MNTPDPTAVRAAEKRLRSCAGDWRLFPYPTAHDDMKTLADAYLALTDPTPLTVEVLVGMGFTKYGCYYSHKQITVTVYKDGTFDFLASGIVWPYPRTVGELRQLLARMEPPHAR